jgi:hypothetical protein
MGLPNISFIVNRSGLGQVVATDDGIMGLVVSGVAVEGLLTAETAHVIYSLEDAEALGIVETVESEDPTTHVISTVASPNVRAWRQIKAFYDEVGTGVKLWIILYVGGVDITMADAVPVAEKLIKAAAGEISVYGICRSAAATAGDLVDGLYEEVIPTIMAAQALAETYQAKMMPHSVVIDGIKFGTESAILNLKERTDFRTSVILAANTQLEASVGQFLGRLASIPVQRKPSRVKDGSLSNLTAKLVDGTISVDNDDVKLGALHDKGYIVYRKFIKRSGYYFSGDPTATAGTDDLNTIARNRIVDKVIKIAYNVYVDELDDDVDITTSGTLEPAICGNLKTKIEKQVKSLMKGEISSFTATVDSAQDILSGLPFNIGLSIIPKGYLNPIKITIGYTNPYNA